MFQSAFSFNGRIRRLEYGISSIIYSVLSLTINLSMINMKGDGAILFIVYIPLLWFWWAQGAKRCHDLGKSGWWLIIPLYILFMLFEDGHPGENEYGDNPKVQSYKTDADFMGENPYVTNFNEAKTGPAEINPNPFLMEDKPGSGSTPL